MKRCRYSVGYITDTGNCRNINQDSLMIRCGRIGREEFFLLAVADGMGGMERGDMASFAATSGLESWWQQRLLAILGGGVNFQKIRDSLLVEIEVVNQTILNQKKEDGGKSGTTLSLVFVYQTRYLLLHIGDSRAYLLRKGEVVQLSEDQTWCHREVDAGHISPAEADVHPLRHALINALGPDKMFDVQEEMGELMHGDSLLLCSDGFYHELDAAGWRQLFQSWKKSQKRLEIAKMAIKAGTAEDNFTAILMHMTGGKKRHGEC